MNFEILIPIAMYVLPTILILFAYSRRRRRKDERSLAVLNASRTGGLMEPPSLHPVIDPALCLGCGACIPACPEKDVLGLISKKAVLIGPANCIGHGACKEACPPAAITLVLGTERRGVDIPTVDASFETNVPGIFVAGELGGMGLIRNAIAQGCEAIESVREMQEVGRSDCLDVVIVGAGPAGFAATLGAKKHGLRYQTLEQESLGGTVAHYPRGKIVMTSPATLPLVGKVKIRETTKEALLDFWLDIEKKTGVRINYNESVESITHVGSEFDVKTQKETYRTRAVVLAIGRRGTPRKLEVPGEESNKVVYRLVDPEQYRGQHVLVVGGGDSALEAATSLTDAGAASVTLAYRGEAFSRAKVKNRERVDRSAKDGLLRLAMQSEVKEIRPDEVVLKTPSDDLSLANDAVIVCAGGILPTGFLKACGIEMRTVHGAPI